MSTEETADTSFLYANSMSKCETKGKGAYLWREVYALRKKNVMYVIGEVILLPRLLIWNIHRIVIIEAGPAQWQVTDHRLEIFDLHIS